MRNLTELDEKEILALAISSEEEDGRIYADFAESLREEYPDSARVFTDMATEESEHRRMLIDTYVNKFGDHIPLVRRQDGRGTVARRPAWQMQPLGIDAVRRQAHQMEADASRFYSEASDRTSDASIRKLLGDLAVAVAGHVETATTIVGKRLPGEARSAEGEDTRKRFSLQIVQPGLVGIGAENNMGFAEALADDGRLSGRGTPYLRGLVCGLMIIAGGIGHTLPFLIGDLWAATAIAGAVTVMKLLTIAWIHWKYRDAPPVRAGSS